MSNTQAASLLKTMKSLLHEHRLSQANVAERLGVTTRKAPRKLHEPILKGAKGRPITAATAGEIISDGAAKLVELGVMTERKHLHDCRGSFATELMMSGATNEEAAELLGWEEKRIRRIRRKYVDGKAIVGAIVERLETWRKSRDGKA